MGSKTESNEQLCLQMVEVIRTGHRISQMLHAVSGAYAFIGGVEIKDISSAFESFGACQVEGDNDDFAEWLSVRDRVKQMLGIDGSAADSWENNAHAPTSGAH